MALKAPIMSSRVAGTKAPVLRMTTVPNVSRNRVVVKASQDENQSLQTLPETVSSDGSSVQNFKLLNAANENINGRCAMLGFTSAVVAELISHQTIFSQVAGKYVEMELVEKPLGGSILGYFAIVALVTMGSLAPTLLDSKNADSKSFGPFTPGLEKTLGRAAMMGISGLLIIEAIKGSSLL